MTSPTKQKYYFATNIIVLISFLWSNLIWAAGIESYKLSAPSKINSLIPFANAFSTGQSVIKNLAVNGIVTKDEFYRRIGHELGRGKAEKFAGVPCLVFSDPKDDSKLAYYVFNPREPCFSRITTHPEVNDSLWDFLVLTGIDRCALSDVRDFKVKEVKYYQRVYA